MLVYSGDKLQFLHDVLSGRIETNIASLLKDKTNRGVEQSELGSW